MKHLLLMGLIGLGIFTVAFTSVNDNVVSTPSRTIVSDTDTTQTPQPDSLSLNFRP